VQKILLHARLVTVPAVYHCCHLSWPAFTEFNKASGVPTARVDVISPHCKDDERARERENEERRLTSL
jgi:hypothetical protein